MIEALNSEISGRAIIYTESPPVWGNTDYTVGSKCGQLVGTHEIGEIFNKIKHLLWFSRLHYLVVVEVDEFLFTIGGSPRSQVVSGGIPMPGVPYKMFCVNGLVFDQRLEIPCSTHGDFLVPLMLLGEDGVNVKTLEQDFIELRDVVQWCEDFVENAR